MKRQRHLMSVHAPGTEQPALQHIQPPTSGQGQNSVFRRCPRHVPFPSNHDRNADIPALRIWAKSRHMHRSKRRLLGTISLGFARGDQRKNLTYTGLRDGGSRSRQPTRFTAAQRQRHLMAAVRSVALVDQRAPAFIQRAEGLIALNRGYDLEDVPFALRFC